MVPAWIIPFAIAAGFAILFLALFRDRLLPAPNVEVATVLATISDSPEPSATTGKAASGGMLFQASGWIEPDPLPIKATSLVDGVIETVEVLEGQEVKKDEVLATLISEDAKLAFATAEQNHLTLESTRDAHLGAIESARKKLEGALAMVKSGETHDAKAAAAADRTLHLEKGQLLENLHA